jgi:hypothetical protein
MPARQACTPDSVHPTYSMRWASSSVPVGYYAVDPQGLAKARAPESAPTLKGSH